MGLSDAEIELRLAALRRQREALDREIADLVLYRELGRRLGGGAHAHPPEQEPDAGPDAGPGPAPAPERAFGQGLGQAFGQGFGRDTPPPPAAAQASRSGPGPGAARIAARTTPGLPASGPAEIEATPKPIPPAIAFTEDAAGARRYGRALVEAACAALARAGRPLHAAEILDILAAQGFTLPGRDPVAALNTRLWKRSGPDGPLRRVGEATYALAPDGEAA